MSSSSTVGTANMSAAVGSAWLLAADAPAPDCFVVISSLHLQEGEAQTQQRTDADTPTFQPGAANQPAGSEQQKRNAGHLLDTLTDQNMHTDADAGSSKRPRCLSPAAEVEGSNVELCATGLRRVHSVLLGQQFLFFRSHLCRWQAGRSAAAAAAIGGSASVAGTAASAGVQFYEVHVSVSSEEELQAVNQALDFMYSGELSTHSHAELFELLKLADKLQGPALAAAAVAAWQHAKSTLPLSLACSLLRDAAAAAWAWAEPLLADCRSAFSSAVNTDQAAVKLATRTAILTALGDAVAVANTPFLCSLLLGLPFTALLWWLRDMEGLVTDSEDTVLYLVDKYVTAKAASLTQDQLQQLRSSVRVQALSVLCQTCVQPNMPWAALTLQEILSVQRWSAAGELLRKDMSASMPAGWVLGPRPASTSQVPDPNLCFNRTSLREALQKAQASSSSTMVYLVGTPVVRSGIELSVGLQGYNRDPAEPDSPAYWCGMHAGHGIIGTTRVIYRHTMVAGQVKVIEAANQLDGGYGAHDWWGKPPVGASMQEESSWEMIFEAEGPEVCVVAQGACVSLA